VVVRNGIIEMFRGHMRLVVNKWGKLTKYPDGVASTPAPPTTVNLENDRSERKFHLRPSSILGRM
jgi:hypothetical protein